MAYSIIKETATTFVLHVLRRWPDREIQISELHDLSGGRYQKENLQNALVRLFEKEFATKENDANRAAWWAITEKGLRGI
ncbi:MAG: hypothetical protein EXR77_12325 [Myxococcales bacterium]|nr:hypothetical protein [Myxococcales bacterium]